MPETFDPVVDAVTTLSWSTKRPERRVVVIDPSEAPTQPIAKPRVARPPSCQRRA